MALHHLFLYHNHVSPLLSWCKGCAWVAKSFSNLLYSSWPSLKIAAFLFWKMVYTGRCSIFEVLPGSRPIPFDICWRDWHLVGCTFNPLNCLRSLMDVH